MTETVATDHEYHGDAQRCALLAEVRGSVLRLLAELPRMPQRVRVSARDVAVELQWPAPGPLPPVTVVATEAPALAVTDLAVTGPDGPPPPRGHQVTAPTVGTFYRAPERGALPFVEVGDVVSPGHQVAILEVMKLMLPVEADRHGVVAEVLRRDGQPVEFGEPLFVLDLVEQG
ncbi:MAG: acetyl-CoA carboxylase biotin carboxyl carrier protein [Pseudonocardiaceae bacterium]